MIRKTLLSFILISANIFGQNNSASPYSSAGLGEDTFNGTQATRHMGGLDVLTDSIHANLLNPASYAFLKFTTYSVGVNYTNNNYRKESIQKYNQRISQKENLFLLQKLMGQIMKLKMVLF